MAKFGLSRGWWIALPVLLLLVLTGLFWPFGEDQGPPVSQKASDDVEIVSWNWNKSRAGDLFVVHGRLRNRTDREFRQVVLELRTQDAGGRTLDRYTIVVEGLQARAEKPFRQDIPRTGKEEMGFLEVRAVEAPR